MKLAYLITAHKNPVQLARLVRSLNYQNVEFYIHIDQKVDLEPFINELNKLVTENIYLIKKRTNVIWAGFSQVESILNSIDEILKRGADFDYLITLTGQDYPIKNNKLIHDFFEMARGKQLIEQFPDIEWRIGRTMSYSFRYIKSRLLIAVLSCLKAKNLMNRFFPKQNVDLGRLYFGPAFFRITRECAQFILDYTKNHSKYVNLFKYAEYADECFFHTIIFNSPFAGNIVNNSLSYMRWVPGKAHTDVLTIHDYSTLEASDRFFARKFDAEVDEDILNMIDRELLFKNSCYDVRSVST